MKKIPLTQGKFALVDDEDFEELLRWKWHAHKQPTGKYYARHTFPRDKITHKQRAITMHGAIMNTPKGMDTDHVNGDGLDNRRENLRICTRSQNSMNRGYNRNNTSGFKGVSFNKQNGKWAAFIVADRKQRHLGYFPTAELAHKAYCCASKEYHGAFAQAK